MKKLLAKIIISVILSFGFHSFAFANFSIVDDDLLPRPDVSGTGGVETDAVQKLPKSSVENIITTAVETVLSVAMILTTIALIVAGVFYITALGNEDKTSKAKNIIIYLLIGMAIMAGSLGIVTGISQFKFLE